MTIEELLEAVRVEHNARLLRLADILMRVVAEEISTGKARELLRAERYPESVVSMINAPPAL